MYAEPGLGFLQHINVTDFDFDDAETTAKVNFKGKESFYEMKFLEFEGFTCVYGWGDSKKDKN